MTTNATTRSRAAWQPLTPRGVAAFASAPLGRLLLVQFVFAIAAAAAVIWCVRVNWYPVISEAVRRLPDEGGLRSGELAWTTRSPRVLAAGAFLAVSVDLQHRGQARSPAHVQVEFGRHDVRVQSLLGYVSCAYPRAWDIPLNRRELEPWWGAWSPPLLWLGLAAVAAVLLGSWSLLASVYVVPVWLLGLYANRDLTWYGSWKLAGAALMPGAIIMTAATVFYGSGALDVVEYLAAACAHIVVGWVYVLIAPLCAWRMAPRSASNPFGPVRPV